MPTAQADIECFLSEFKRLAARGKLAFLEDRRKYTDTLARHGLTKADVIDTLMLLSVRDYYAGPEPDRRMPGFVWFFAPDLSTDAGPAQLYIKLKIQPDGEHALCLSFHDIEHPIVVFPYRP